MNPFVAMMVVLNLCAAVYELVKHRAYPLAGVFVCYAVATLLLGLIGGKK